MSKINPYGLIFANDITDSAEKAVEISKTVAPYLDAIKIGVATASLGGKDFSLISNIKDAVGKVVIADFKIADIGFRNQNGVWEGTNEKIVKKLARAGANYITCHTFPGTSSIQECVEVGRDLGVKILTLPYMTGVGAELFFGQPIDRNYCEKVMDKLKISIDLNKCETITDLILSIGEAFGVEGFIGPSNNPPITNHYRRFTGKPVYGPGVGRQTKDMTPEQQLFAFYKNCGPQSAPIIGSAIYNAKDPVRAAEEFMQYRDQAVAKLRGE
jgi:orotidine-5'-phosphate decarboxylase